MKLNQLFEGVSAVLFHATSPANAVKAVSSGVMYGFQLNGEYVLSFARSRTGQYPEFMGDDMVGTDEPIVVLELNGRRLGERYKGKAIDAAAPAPGDYDYGDYSKTIDYMEDRLVSKKQQFDIMPGTFIRAHLIQNGKGNDGGILARAAKELEKQIPCVFYNTVRDFQSNRPVKQIAQAVSQAVDPSPFIDTIVQALGGTLSAMRKLREMSGHEYNNYGLGIMDLMKSGDQDIRGEVAYIVNTLVSDGHVKQGAIRTIGDLINTIKSVFPAIPA